MGKLFTSCSAGAQRQHRRLRRHRYLGRYISSSTRPDQRRSTTKCFSLLLIVLRFLPPSSFSALHLGGGCAAALAAALATVAIDKGCPPAARYRPTPGSTWATPAKTPIGSRMASPTREWTLGSILVVRPTGVRRLLDRPTRPGGRVDGGRRADAAHRRDSQNAVSRSSLILPRMIA